MYFSKGQRLEHQIKASQDKLKEMEHEVSNVTYGRLSLKSLCKG